MNGAQDLGGMMGFGPVVAEQNEPVFHGRWESRVLANVIATQALGWWSGDASRFARESLDPRFYLTRSYYEIWFAALEKILAEHKLVAADEIATGHALHEARRPERVFEAAGAATALRRGWPSERETQTQPRFAVGQKVDARVISFDKKSRKLQVSIKALEIAEEKEAVAQYGSTDSGASLGDILGAALKKQGGRDE